MKGKRGRMWRFWLLSDLIGGDIIGIEVKLGKESRNREIRGLGWWVIFLSWFKVWIARNWLDSNFVGIMEGGWRVWWEGSGIKNGNGGNINGMKVWKWDVIVVGEIGVKIGVRR